MKTGPTDAGAGREEFLGAMARAATGVAVVATDGPAGRFGLTVSSVASVSADPPLVLACVSRGSVAHGAIRENGVFSVNLLSTRQKELSDSFAGRAPRGRAYGFDDGIWRAGPSGAPLLKGAIAVFECTVAQAHDAGSHTVFIGRVTLVTPGTGEPLLYTARAYGQALRWGRDGGAPGTKRATETTGTTRQPAVA